MDSTVHPDPSNSELDIVRVLSIEEQPISFLKKRITVVTDCEMAVLNPGAQKNVFQRDADKTFPLRMEIRNKQSKME